MKKLIKKIKAYDLQKAYPGYFNKIVFRVGFFLIFFILGLILLDEGLTFRSYYYECPDNTNGCDNPFYNCNQEIIPSSCIETTPQKYCDAGLCDKAHLQPGEMLGRKPGYLANNFITLMFSILGFSFIVNYILFKLNKKMDVIK